METTNNTTNSSPSTTNNQQPQQQHPNHQQRNNNDENAVQLALESSPTTLAPSDTTTNGTATTTSNSSVVYDVEHLATFSTNSGNQNNSENNRTTTEENSGNNNNSKTLTGIGNGSKDNTTTPKVALQRLFELEKLSGIWTQHMQIELRDEFMLIVDCETNSTVERFNRDCVSRPEAFNHYNDIYNNIVVFIIQQPTDKFSSSGNNDSELFRRQNFDSNDGDIIAATSEDYSNSDPCDGELHIFQCVSHKAQQLVSDILAWKSSQKSSSQNQNQNMSTKNTNNNNNNNNQAASSSKQQGQNSSSASNGKTSSSVNNNKSSESKKSPPIATNTTTTASAAQGSGKPVVTVASSTNSSENVPIVNVNVKETVQVFNQIAALREKSSKPTSPVSHTRPLSDASGASIHSTPGAASVGPTTVAAQESAAASSPNSNGSQLYKQRSIRATLAPKYVGTSAGVGGQQVSPTNSTKLDQQQQTSQVATNNSGSSSSSVDSSSDAKLLAYQSANLSTSRTHQQPDPNNLREANDAISTKQQSAAVGSNQQHKVSSSKSGKTQQQQQQAVRTQSNSSHSHTSSSSQSHLDQVTTNESYVSVLNHCFDDIEKFIIRLQQAVAAIHELQAKRKLAKRSAAAAATSKGEGGYQAKASGVSSPPMNSSELAMLNSKARGPSEDDYFEILSKFKLAFNLLAKLKGCIHEPNAPELVHFLFTPLAIIIESARNASPLVDPTLVGIPYLNQDALDLLSNCCTSKESDMWISLGPNWTQTIDMNLLKASRLPSSFQPIFSDGWAPIICELELIGLVAPPTTASSSSLVRGESLSASERTSPTELINSNLHHHHNNHHHTHGGRSHDGRRNGSGGGANNSSSQYLLPDEGALGASTINSYSDLEHPTFSNGGGGKGKVSSSHAISSSGRGAEYKRNAPQPLPGNHHHHSTRLQSVASSSQQKQQPYLDQINQVPYGYPPPSSLLGAADQLDQRQSRNIRFSAAASEGQRRVKQSSRYQQDYSTMASNYDSSHYPMMQQQPPILDDDDDDDLIDVDLLAHQNIHHPHHQQQHNSDDYSELQEHYLDDHQKIVPGPSHLHRHHNQQQQQHYRNSVENSSHHPSSRHNNSRQKSANSSTMIYNRPTVLPPPFETVDYMNEADHEAMLLDLGPAQTEWFFELQARGALIVRVLFTREANNDKELSVRRGEILEVLDDTRKWWRARNIDLQVAHVPHTIVAIMQGYQTLDELLANSPGNLEHEASMVNSNHRFPRRHLPMDHNQHQWQHGDKRNSKTAGAFRYF